MASTLPIVGVDIETVSACSIKLGAWPYSEHPSTRVWCVVFVLDGAPGMGRYVARWQPGQELPRWVTEWVTKGKPLVAHNAGFERSVWANILAPRHGFPVAPPTQFGDTQAMGLAVNLPMTLKGLAKVVGCATQKDDEGSQVMLELATATEDPGGGWTYPEPTQAQLDRLLAYCEDDVHATLDIYRKLPQLSVAESMTYAVDTAINARGIYLDREFASNLRVMAELRKERLAHDTWDRTAGVLANSTSTPDLKGWVKERGVTLPMVTRKKTDGTYTKSESLDRGVTLELLEDPNLNPEVRAILTNRLEANKATSLARLARVAPMTGKDGRLRNALQFCGANTGRWTSYGIQVHNLPKDQRNPAEVELARSLVEAGDLDTLEMVVDRPMESMSQMLRSVICAPPGRELIAADYSAVEARVLAWLAGQEDVVQFLHAYDADMALFRAGRGPKPEDLYEFTARDKLGSDNRQLGKVCVLALGYGMGAVKFVDTAAGWGVPLSPKQARQLQRAWREANPQIAAFWYELGDAVRDVILDPAKGPIEVARITVHCDPHRRHFSLELPSGRRLFYWKPSVVETTRTIQVVDESGAITEKEFTTDSVRFWAMAKDKSNMELVDTYGGKLVENVTQATARDLLAAAMARIESVDPYELVVHVHDSLAAEVPAGAGDVAEFEHLMAENPSWALGLPTAVEGYRDTRFRG